MERLLVLGKSGQVGRALSRLLGLKTMVLGRDEADFSQPKQLYELVLRERPTAVINAVAYTAVDKAEEESTLAYAVNAESPALLARACAELGIPLMHYSTDYVFDGSGSTPWKEEDATGPLNVYGQSKRAGEEAILQAGGQHLIFRTSWVYDADGKNFLNTMLRLGAERDSLNVVSDQIGAPTYALHLADRSLNALTRAINMPAFPSGIYHLANAGETSWHGFAQAIFGLARTLELPVRVQEVQPIPSSAYPAPAPRPLNSRLDCSKAREQLGAIMPSWEIGLQEAMYMKKKRYLQQMAQQQA